MLAELDPETRTRREKERRPFAGKPTFTGRLAPNEVPFTSYLTGGEKGPEETAGRINAWAGVG